MDISFHSHLDSNIVVAFIDTKRSRLTYESYSHCYKILYMARQLCCHGMCKNSLQFDGQQRNYTKVKFPLNSNCGQKIISKMGPRVIIDPWISTEIKLIYCWLHHLEQTSHQKMIHIFQYNENVFYYSYIFFQVVCPEENWARWKP